MTIQSVCIGRKTEIIRIGKIFRVLRILDLRHPDSYGILGQKQGQVSSVAGLRYIRLYGKL